MTALYPFGKSHRFVAPPWMRDTSIHYAWQCRRSNMTLLTGVDDGGTISSVAPDIGAQPLTVDTGGTVTYRRSFDGTAVGCFVPAPSGSSSMGSAVVGASISGTAVPVSIAFVGKLPAAPSYPGVTGTQWCLFSWSRSTTNAPFFMVAGNRGSTICQVQRRNNAGASDAGAPMDVGTSRFLLVSIYDGVSFNTRLNQAVVDDPATTPATAGGACTLNTFTIGGFRNPAIPSFGLFSDVHCSFCIVSHGVAWPESTYLAIERYISRLLGL